AYATTPPSLPSPAARSQVASLAGAVVAPRWVRELPLEDRWILSRLAAAVDAVDAALQAYNPAAALAAARDFFWSELCDWYLELVKPRFRADAAPAARATAQQTLAAVLDQVLRLLHPFVPFLTEALWARLRALAAQRGLAEPFAASALLVHARWPDARAAWRDAAAEGQIAAVQQWASAIREARARYQVAPRERLPVRIQADGEAAATLHAGRDLLAHMAGCAEIAI